MAMSLSSLGRGSGRIARWLCGLLLIVGALIGGGAVGGLLASLGSLMNPYIEGLSASLLIAYAFALRNRRILPIGLKRQVPRRWARTLPAPVTFTLWGALLGSGLATVIPYSSLIAFGALETALPVSLGVARRRCIRLIPRAPRSVGRLSGPCCAGGTSAPVRTRHPSHQ